MVRVIDHNDITRSLLQNSLNFFPNHGVFLCPLVWRVGQTLSESASRGFYEVRQVYQPERLAVVDERIQDHLVLFAQRRRDADDILHLGQHLGYEAQFCELFALILEFYSHFRN